MTIYTRTGDQGETDLLGGPRVSKDTARLEACGDLDELNALLGLARCEPLPKDCEALLEQIQRRLFGVGTELVAIAPFQAGATAIGRSDVEAIEQAIDRCDAKLAPLNSFVLPGGSRAAAVLHVARTVCRRVERRLVTLLRSEPGAVSSDLFSYINRLGDLLFVLSRIANLQAQSESSPC